MGRFYNSKNLSITQQDQRIKEKFPQFTRSQNHKQGVWTGDLKPKEWSPKYKIRIIYKLKRHPKVSVISPELLFAKGKSQLPHVYSGNELCLFYPNGREWASDKFIADTIIPWTSLWLFYYEDWLYTGQWKGGGIHPNKKRKAKNEKRIKI